MGDIPEDVMRQAFELRKKHADEAMMIESWKRTDHLIARAILAERQRCAEIVCNLTAFGSGSIPSRLDENPIAKAILNP